ncbi:hypothetical protein FOZ62_017423, partial [Perkinsus olseni]
TPSSSTPLVKEEIAAVGHRNSKKQGRQSSSSRQNGDPSSRYANYVCHECKQRGHIRWFCPLRKNKQQPKSGNADKGQGKSALRADFIRRHGFSKYVNSADGASSIK